MSEDTLRHIRRVNELLINFAQEILERAKHHDDSKLEEPEASLFASVSKKLSGMTYGSEEYKASLAELKPALQHHYENNSHHPEHYQNGVSDMDLIDLVEMFCDWKAAGERHKDGCIYKSIELNEKRFNISKQLCDIFEMTAYRFLDTEKPKEVGE